MENKAETVSIDDLRREIDEIDSQLLIMLNQRASCVLSIGKIKKRNNLPIHVPAREEKVLQRLQAENRGPVPPESVAAVFRAIIEQMKILEEEIEGETRV